MIDSRESMVCPRLSFSHTRITMISSLIKEQVEQLTVVELAARMDSIFLLYREERYEPDYLERTKAIQERRPSVSKILSTIQVQKMTEEQQRQICRLTFNWLLQMAYTEFTSAISNHYIFDSNYNETMSWLSPSVQIRHAGLTQFRIISSRIAMECFMELVHYLGTGERINSKKSTFGKFKKWLLIDGNKYSYFARHVLRAFIFDREYRTPEVHASSRLSSAVLRMHTPSPEEHNSSGELTNIMLNVWCPLLEILTIGKASSIQGNDDDVEWLKSYLRDDGTEISRKLKQIFEQMKSK